MHTLTLFAFQADCVEHHGAGFDAQTLGVRQQKVVQKVGQLLPETCPYGILFGQASTRHLTDVAIVGAADMFSSKLDALPSLVNKQHPILRCYIMPTPALYPPFTLLHCNPFHLVTVQQAIWGYRAGERAQYNSLHGMLPLDTDGACMVPRVQCLQEEGWYVRALLKN